MLLQKILFYLSGVLLYFVDVSKAQSWQTIDTYLSTINRPIDCIGGVNCQTGAGQPNLCPPDCTRCDSPTQCTQCKYGFFVYHTPNSTIECVKCPFNSDYAVFDASNTIQKCPECNENGDSWEFTRQCVTTLVYTPKVGANQYPTYRVYDTGSNHYSFYLKWNTATNEYDVEQIEHCLVLQSSDFIRYQKDGMWVYLNGQIAPEQKVEQEEVVQEDWSSRTFEQRINFKNDENFDDIFDEVPDLGMLKEFNRCTQCEQGYIVDQQTLNCVPCPSNCLLCGYKPSGDLYCKDCGDGYALDHLLICRPCITGCASCYFGNSVYNISDLAVEEYEQVIVVGGITNIEAHFQNRFFKKADGSADLSQNLCFKCTNTNPDESYIPTLDLLQCQKCSEISATFTDKCYRCEYYNKVSEEIRLPDNLHPPIPSSQFADYQIRCLICANDYYHDIDGVQCLGPCSTDITNCAKCYQGKFATNANLLETYTFNDLDDEDPILLFKSSTVDADFRKMCVQCKDNYMLANDRLSCIAIDGSNPPTANKAANCVNFVYDFSLTTPIPVCAKCEAQYVLEQNKDAATQGDQPYICIYVPSDAIDCSQGTGDDNCIACYRYNPDSGMVNNYNYQCIQCEEGMVPTLGLCKKCDAECGICRQLNDFGQDLTSYLIYKRPALSIPEYENFVTKFNVPPEYIYCFERDPTEDHNQIQRRTGIIFTCLDFGECNCVKKTGLTDGVGMECIQCTVNQIKEADDPYQVINEDGFSCLMCPEYCLSCTERTPYEIAQINSKFIAESDFGFYSGNCDRCAPSPVGKQVTWNTEFSRCSICESGDKACSTVFKYERNIDCKAPLSGYTGSDITWQSIFDTADDDGQGTLVYEFSQTSQIDYIQNYNRELAEIIELNIYILTEGQTMVCQIFQNLQFTTQLTQLVFSVKEVRLNINTKDKNSGVVGMNRAKFEFNGNLTFSFFNEIKIQNIDVTFHKDLVAFDVYSMIFQDAMKGVGIELNNVNFGSENKRVGNPITDTDKYVQFVIENGRQLIIQNCNFQSFTYPIGISPFVFTYEAITTETTFYLMFENMVFENNYFLDTDLIGLQVRESSINFKNVKFKDNILISSTFITDRSLPPAEQFPKILINAEILIFENNILDTSEMFLFRQLNEFSGFDWFFDGKNIFNSSEQGHVVFRVNTLEIEQVRFGKYFSTKDATIFGSPPSSNALHLTETMVYEIVDLESDNYVCDQSFACLIHFKTPLMDGNTERIAVRLKDFKITRLNAKMTESNQTLQEFGYENIRQMRDENTETTLIVIEKSELANIINVNFIDCEELRGIYLMDVWDIVISNGYCGQSYDVPALIEVDHEVSLYITGVPVNAKELSELEIEIPKDVSGQHAPQMGACIEVDFVQRIFKMVDYVIENCIFVDTSIINIDNGVSDSEYDTRVIFSNVTFRNNIIAITDDTGNDAVIKISTQALILIAMNGVTFQDIILKTYSNAIVTLPSVSGILIVSLKTDVYLNNMLFSNLTSLNNYNGLYIDVRLLNVSNSTFKGANLQIDDDPFTEIENNGGFGQLLYSEYMNFTNVTVMDTWANMGGAFYLYPKSDCFAVFDRCTFNNTQTSFKYTSKGFGGAFYVDNENIDNMVINVTDSKFVNNSARLSGGAIYHNGIRKDSEWNIERCLFENQTSLMGAIFYGEYFRRDNASLYFRNVTFRGSKQETLRYFMLLKTGKFLKFPPDLSTVDNVASNALFFLIAADLWMQNNIFENFWYMRIYLCDLSGIEDYNSTYRNIKYYVDDIMSVTTSTIHWVGTRMENITYDEEGGSIKDCIAEQNANTPEEVMSFAVQVPLCFIRDARQKSKYLMRVFDSPEQVNLTSCVFKRISCNVCVEGLFRIDTVIDGAEISESIFQQNKSHSGAGITFYKEDPWSLLLLLRRRRSLQESSIQYEEFKRVNPEYTFKKLRNLQTDVSFPDSAQYVVSNSTFRQNNVSAAAAGATGAGVIFYFQEGTVTGCNFEENFSNDVGAGVVVRQTYANIKKNTFLKNEALSGPSIRFLATRTPEGSNDRIKVKAIVDAILLENSFINNTATYGTDSIIFECIFGEFFSGINCEDCPAGSYSLVRQDVNSATCLSCQSALSFCPGAFVIQVYPGYWRPHLYTDKIDKCVNNLENCLGGNNTDYEVIIEVGNHLCAQGHTGALCEACDTYGDFWGESYASAGAFSCTACIDLIATNTITILLVSVFTLVIVAVTVRSNLITNIQINCIRNENQFELGIFRVLTLKFFKQDIGALFIKIFTNYTQILGAVATFQIDLPSVVGEVSESVGAPIKKVLFSLDCMLAGFSFIPIEYMRLVWALIIPGIYALILVGGYLTYCHQTKTQVERHIFVSGAIFLYIYYQPNIILQFINVTSCRQVSDNQYIMSQVDKVCYTQEHVLWLTLFIVPNLILFGFIIPLILFRLMQNNYQLLGTTAVRLKYGLLYNEYKDSAFFWELLKIIEKLSITFLLNVFNSNDITKGTTVFLVILIYTIFSLRFNPYQNVNLNNLDFDSSMACGASILLAVLASDNRPSNPEGNIYLFFLAIFMIGIINIYFITVFVREIILIKLDSLGPNGEAIKQKLQDQVPCLRKYIRLKTVPRENTMAQWIMLSKYRRDWSKRKSSNPDAQFFTPSKKLDYNDFLQEEHIKDYYENTIKRKEQEEQKKKEEEKKIKDAAKNQGKDVKVSPQPIMDDPQSEQRIIIEVEQEVDDKQEEKQNDQYQENHHDKQPSEGVQDILKKIDDIEYEKYNNQEVLNKNSSPERIISPNNEINQPHQQTFLKSKQKS